MNSVPTILSMLMALAISSSSALDSATLIGHYCDTCADHRLPYLPPRPTPPGGLFGGGGGNQQGTECLDIAVDLCSDDEHGGGAYCEVCESSEVLLLLVATAAHQPSSTSS